MNSNPERLRECEVRRLLQWLGDHGPDEWHAVALGWNWDAPVDPLRWIIEQAQCDAATAQFIFWQARLGDRADLVELAAEIASRWSRGQFRTARFSVKGQIEVRNDPLDGIDIDDCLRVAVDGPEVEAVDIPFNEGIPAEITWACFEELGETPPSWLREQLSGAGAEEATAPPKTSQSPGSLLMQNRLTEAEIDTLMRQPSAFRDFEAFRQFVDSAMFRRLTDQAIAVRDQGGDPSQLREEAMRYLARMQKPYDPQLYPDLIPKTQPRGIARIFGRKGLS